MRILLDTHALLWFHESSPKLSNSALEVILSKQSERFVSYATLWELAIKSSMNRLVLGTGMNDFVNEKIVGHGMKVLNMEVAHLEKLALLPWHHRDPFDRILVAQALSENLTLVSGDKQMKSYPVGILW